MSSNQTFSKIVKNAEPKLATGYINDFAKIINNQFDKGNSDNSIYDEILAREKDLSETIKRVMEYKKIQEAKKKVFGKQSIKQIFENLFKNLNKILEDIMKTRNMTPKRFKRIFEKGHRIIYVGILFIIIAGIMALIEIADSVDEKRILTRYGILSTSTN